MSYVPDLKLHTTDARNFLTDNFDEFPGIDTFVEKLAQLLAAAELLGAKNATPVVSASASAPADSKSNSNSKSKPKGKGNNSYAQILSIVSSINNGNKPNITEMANSFNIVTCDNIKGPATRGLYDSNSELRELASGKSMTLAELVAKAKTMGKGTACSGIVYGLLNTDVVHTIIEQSKL